MLKYVFDLRNYHVEVRRISTVLLEYKYKKRVTMLLLTTGNNVV